MSYRLSSKKRQQQKSRRLKTIGVLLLVLLGYGVFLLLGGTAASLSSGTVSVFSSIGDVFRAVGSDKQELIQKNAELQQELDQLQADSFLYDAVVARNNMLLAELGRGEDSSKIVAGVTKQPPFSPYDTFTLDAGRTAGVQEGNLLLFSDYVALGEVHRVTESSSHADLFSTPHKRTRVVLGNSILEAEGQGNGVLRIDVPRDFIAESGDSVTLPGYELYVVGTVVEMLGDPQDSFRSVMVRVPVNIQAVPLVSIVPYTKDNEATEVSNTQ